MSTNALQPLINEKNEEIKGKAISSIQKALESGKHPVTGKYSKKINVMLSDNARLHREIPRCFSYHWLMLSVRPGRSDSL